MPHDEERAAPLRPRAGRPAPSRSAPVGPDADAAARVPGGRMSGRQVLALQRSVGNRHVAAAMARLVGAADERLGEPPTPSELATPTAVPRAGRSSPAPEQARAGRPVVVQRTRWMALVNALLGRSANPIRPGLVGRGRGAQGPQGGAGLFGQFFQMLGQQVGRGARRQRALPGGPAALATRPPSFPSLMAAGVVTHALLAAAMRYAPLRRLAVSLGLDPSAVPGALVAAVPTATGGQQAAATGTTAATGPTAQQPGAPGASGGPGGTPTRTDSMVPGLYQSVDPAVAPTGWTFIDTVTATPRTARVRAAP